MFNNEIIPVIILCIAFLGMSISLMVFYYTTKSVKRERIETYISHGMVRSPSGYGVVADDTKVTVKITEKYNPVTGECTYRKTEELSRISLNSPQLEFKNCVGVKLNPGDAVYLKNGSEYERCEVVKPETSSTGFGAWVFVPSRGFASDYALTNIFKPV